MKLRLSKCPMGLGWSAWLLIAPLAGWAPTTAWSAEQARPSSQGYTVNFSNVSIKEFLRFISKSTGQNFIYDEKDFTDFPVTVVSEEPTSSQNLMTILVQVLRTQGYSLLEQGDNLLIHRSTDVSQLAQVRTDSTEAAAGDGAALVTQVFRLRSVSPEAVLPILQPLVSKSARIDASKETNQIIVTDVSQNVAKIGQLIEALDAPNPLVTVETYDTTSAFSQETLDIAEKILQPLVGKSPFLMQAQPDSQQVFIVASPFLATQAKEVLAAIEKGQPTTQNGQPFFYPAQTQSAETLLGTLQEMGEGLKTSGVKRSDLLQAIETAQVVPSSNSLLLLADLPTQKKLEELLKQIDSPRDPKAGANSLLFRPTQLSLTQLESTLKEIAAGLKTAGQDADLARVLESARVIAGQGLLLSGSSATLAKAQELLKDLDAAGVGGTGQATVVPLKHIAPTQARAGLNLIASSLAKEGLSDEALFRGIQSVKGLAGSNAVLVSGAPGVIKRIQGYLTQLDVAVPQGALAGALTTIPLHGDGNAILAELRKSTAQFDPALEALVETASFLPDSNSLLVTGEKALVEQLQELILAIEGSQMMVYKPKNMSVPGLLEGLNELVQQLKAADHPDTFLIKTLQSARGVPAANSVLLSAPQPLLTQVQNLLLQLDTPNAAQASNQFFLARPASGDAQELLNKLQELGSDLASAGLADASLLAALRSSSVADGGQAIAFSGDKTTIATIQEMVKSVEGTLGGPAEIVMIKNISGALAKEDLIQFIEQMGLKGTVYKSLQEAAQRVTVMPDGQSLALHGSPDQIAQLKKIIAQLDQPPAQGSQLVLIPIPPTIDPERILGSIDQLAKSDQGDRMLQQVLRSRQYLSDSQAIALSGPPDLLKRAEEVIKTAVSQQGETQTITFYPKNVATAQLLKEIQESATSLQKAGANFAMVKALQSAHEAAGNKGIVLQVDKAEVEPVNQFLAHLDDQTGSQIRLVNIPAGVSTEMFLKGVDDLETRLASSPSPDQDLLQALKSRAIVGNSRSVSFTGSPGALKQLDSLLTQINFQESATQASSLWLYVVRESSVSALQQSLEGVAKDLLASGNPTDQQVAKALQSARYNESSHSLLFSAPSDILALVQKIVPTFDIGEGAPAGKPQLFLYRVQHATVEQVEAGLNALGATLNPSNPSDQAFEVTLKSAKPMPDGKSILFTGDPTSLQRLQQQLAKLDGDGLSPTSVGGSKFLIYRLQAASPTRVEMDLRALAASLQKSGLEEPGLFRTIANMQVDLKSNALIFSGEEAELEQLRPIIAVYDVSTTAAPNTSRAVIEPVANSAFMIYPLQYILGNEIESTLRQMGNDLQKAKSQTSENLLHAISTMQWIQASNTLCFNGDTATLEKLRALVQNLDQPVRQVFVEVLVLRTSLQESYQFGLDWAGFGQIDPNYGIGFANLMPQSNSALALTNDVANAGNGIVKPPSNTTPTKTGSVGNEGFSLAAIGNVVRHNGQTFFDLGSLVQALQTDTRNTIVINPKIIAQDNNTATIFSGQTYGFISQQTAVFSTSTTNATTIDYRTVGVQLNITPIITGDVVTLEIDQVYSNIVAGFQPNSNAVPNTSSVPLGSGSFPTDNVHLTTRAHIPDQAILCISGVVFNQTNQTTAQIPCLGGIPLIGALFTQEQTNDNKDTLLIFVKPYILASIDEMKAITQANAKRLRQSGDCNQTYDVQKAFDSIGYDKVPQDRGHEVPCIIE